MLMVIPIGSTKLDSAADHLVSYLGRQGNADVDCCRLVQLTIPHVNPEGQSVFGGFSSSTIDKFIETSLFEQRKEGEKFSSWRKCNGFNSSEKGNFYESTGS